MAITPNRAPDAPVEDIPDAAKFPPKTKPKIPALMYTMKKRIDPMAVSISRPIVNWSSILKPRWTKPACRKIGVIKRHHWFGAGV